MKNYFVYFINYFIFAARRKKSYSAHIGSLIFQNTVYIINHFTTTMTENKLTPQESMAIITRMIEASKQRRTMPDLRISIMWATVTIISAAIVLIFSLIDYTPWINLVWLAIPIVGVPAKIVMTRKNEEATGTKTAIDMISDGIWKTVGTIAIALTAICLIFNLLGYTGTWITMFYFAFIVVGFGAAMQGIVLREKSYLFGGIFSIIAGFTTVALTLCQIPLLMIWALPLYILCFLLMFIVPAFIIRKKFNAAQQ